MQDVTTPQTLGEALGLMTGEPVTVPTTKFARVTPKPPATLGEALGLRPPLTAADALSEVGAEQLPFLGQFVSAGKVYELYDLASKIENGSATQEEVDKIRDLLERGGRDTTTGYLVTKILTDLPAYAIEFAATKVHAAERLAQTGAMRTAAAAIKKSLREVLENQAARAVSKGIGVLGTSAVQTALMPGRILASAGQRALQERLGLTDDRSEVVLTGSLPSLAEALPKGVLDTYIENLSEHSGGLVPSDLGLKTLATRLLGEYLAITPDATLAKTLEKLASKTGWHGVIHEMGEERFGDALRAALLGDPWANVIPSAKQAAAEAIAFALPGTAAGAAELVSGALKGRGQAQGGAAQPPTAPAPQPGAPPSAGGPARAPQPPGPGDTDILPPAWSEAQEAARAAAREPRIPVDADEVSELGQRAAARLVAANRQAGFLDDRHVQAARLVKPRGPIEKWTQSWLDERGVEAVWVDAGKPLPLSGLHLDGALVLDANAPSWKRMRAVALHELAHWYRTSRRQSWERAYADIVAVDPDGMRQAMEEYGVERLVATGAALEGPEIANEGFSRYVESLVGYIDLTLRDRQRAVRIATGNPGFMRSLADAAIRLVNSILRTKIPTGMQRQLEAFRREAEDLVYERQKTRGTQQRVSQMDPQRAAQLALRLVNLFDQGLGAAPAQQTATPTAAQAGPAAVAAPEAQAGPAALPSSPAEQEAPAAVPPGGAAAAGAPPAPAPSGAPSVVPGEEIQESGPQEPAPTAVAPAEEPAQPRAASEQQPESPAVQVNRPKESVEDLVARKVRERAEKAAASEAPDAQVSSPKESVEDLVARKVRERAEKAGASEAPDAQVSSPKESVEGLVARKVRGRAKRASASEAQLIKAALDMRVHAQSYDLQDPTWPQRYALFLAGKAQRPEFAGSEPQKAQQKTWAKALELIVEPPGEKHVQATPWEPLPPLAEFQQSSVDSAREYISGIKDPARKAQADRMLEWVLQGSRGDMPTGIADDIANEIKAHFHPGFVSVPDPNTRVVHLYRFESSVKAKQFYDALGLPLAKYFEYRPLWGALPSNETAKGKTEEEIVRGAIENHYPGHTWVMHTQPQTAEAAGGLRSKKAGAAEHIAPAPPALARPPEPKDPPKTLGEIADELNDMFSVEGGHLFPAEFAIELGFDEEKYLRAKPIFERAAGLLGDKARDPETLIDALIDALLDNGLKASKLVSMQPYLTRFAKEALAPKASLHEAIAQEFRRGQSIKGIVQLRKLAEENGLDGYTDKELEEQAELAVVTVARERVAAGRAGNQPDATIYRALLELYALQPTLAERTSEQRIYQAYSTPIPMAFVASRLARVTDQDVVLEPTAGNGALLIEANPNTAIVNEIQPSRASMLRQQGFDVTMEDALQMEFPEGATVVLTNPPFGTDEAGHVLDWEIPLRALEALPDDGRAVLIIGSPAADQHGRLPKLEVGRAERYREGPVLRFMQKLYDNWRVVEHFIGDGDLYRKQGAGWPVDIIVIAGRGPSTRTAPALIPPKVVESYEELEAYLPAARHVRAPGDGSGTGLDPRVPGPVPGPSRVPARTQGKGRHARRAGTGRRLHDPRGPVASPERSGERRDDGGAAVDGNVAGKPAERAGGPGPRVAGEGPSAASQGESAQPEQPAVRGEPESLIRAEEAGEYQVRYVPTATLAKSVDSLMPKNMHDAYVRAAQELQSRLPAGYTFDRYVAEKLGMTLEHAARVFSAEQIDALALAFDNLDRGASFIIGDQTGIGKGRFVAGVLAYARRIGAVPVFMTEKPDLYADLHRDLYDIGVTDMRVFVTNSGMRGAKAIALPPLPGTENEGTLEALTPARMSNAIDEVIRTGKMPDGFHAIFTTYDQMRPVKGSWRPRHDAMRALAPSSVFVLDESHNAVGQEIDPRNKKEAQKPRRSQIIREMLAAARGAVFSSATWAKNPYALTLYFRTDLIKAFAGQRGDAMEQLKDALDRGGHALQQIASNALAASGQYLRRERSYDGVSFREETIGVNLEQAEAVAAKVSALIDMDLKLDIVRIDVAMRFLASGGKLQHMNHLGLSAADTVAFASIMHNITSQTLLALKAEAAARMAVAAWERGEKPILTVSSTLETVLDEFLDETGKAVGDSVATLHLGHLLMRYLRNMLRLTFRNQNNEQEYYYITDEDLREVGHDAVADSVNALREELLKTDPGLPISPIDRMLRVMTDAGMKVGEITGRQKTINDKTKVVEARKTSPRIKQATIKAFQTGELDGLVINRSGATGISLHATPSSDGGNPKRRHMLIVQPEPGIDTFMQILGRVHRTGQALKPMFTNVVANVPAERRIAARVRKKLAGLNAQVSSNTESAVHVGDIDFLNKYGDSVAADYLDGDVTTRLRLRLVEYRDADTGAADEGLAKRLTGRMESLPLAKQEEIASYLVNNYQMLIESLDRLGMNDLVARTLEVDARFIQDTKRTLTKGIEGDGSPFAQPSVAVMADLKRLSPALTYEDAHAKATLPKGSAFVDSVEKATAEAAEQATAHVDAIQKQVEATTEDLQAAEGRYRALAENADPKERSKLAVLVATLRDRQHRLMHEADMAKAQVDLINYDGLRLRNQLEWYAPGQPVLVGTAQESLHGIVLGVQRVKHVKSDMAPSAYELRIITTAGDAAISVPFSQLGRKFKVIEWPELDVRKAFDDAAKSPREIRPVILGNILAGFAAVNRKGIVTFIRGHDGGVYPAVLLAKNFSIAKAAQKPAGEPARTALDLAGARQRWTQATTPGTVLATTDGTVQIGLTASGRGVIVARGKSLHTDRSLLRLLDSGGFRGRGAGALRATFERSNGEAIIDRLSSYHVKAFTEPKDTAQLALDVWHGSPDTGIGQLDPDLIRSGAGTLAFGWGVYFRDVQAIPHGYRQKMVLAPRPQSDALYRVVLNIEREDLIDYDAATFDDLGPKAMKATLEILEELKAEIRRSGHAVHETDDVAYLERMIAHNNPQMGLQYPSAGAAAYWSLSEIAERLWTYRDVHGIPFESTPDEVRNVEAPRWVAEQYVKRGIYGIRYAANYHRGGNREGMQNIVVFDPSKIDVVQEFAVEPGHHEVTEAMREQVREAAAKALKEGEATAVGSQPNPIADTSTNPEIRAFNRGVREVRGETSEAETRRWADARRQAEAALSSDWEGVRGALMERVRRGELLSDWEQVALDRVSQEDAHSALHGDSAAYVRAVQARWLYMNAGRDVARGLAIRRGAPPSARARMADLLTTPGPDVRHKLDVIERERRDPATPEERARDLDAQAVKLMADEAKRLEKAADMLREMGFPPELITDDWFQDMAAISRIARAVHHVKAKRFDWLIELRLSSMLGGPLTQIANITGNAFNIGLHQGLGRVVEAMVNTVVRDPKSATWGEVYAYYKSLLPAFIDSVGVLLRAYRYELPVFALELKNKGVPVELAGSKVDVLESHAIGDIPVLGFNIPVGRIIRAPSLTSLLAFDEFFKSVSATTEAHALAYRAAKAEGLSGDALATRVEDILHDYGHPVHVRSLFRARELTFQNEDGSITRFGLQARGAIDRIFGGIPVGSFLLPFVRTPVAIFKTGLKDVFYPVLAIRNAAQGKWRGRPDRMTEDLAHSLLAFGIVTLTLALVAGGDDDEFPLITGSGSLDKGERDLQYRTIPPYSIRVPFTRRWISYRRVEPGAVSLATVVDLANEANRYAKAGAQASFAASLGRLITSVGNQLSDKTFLQTLGDIYEILVSQESGKAAAPRLIADTFVLSMIPNVIRQPILRMDPYVRENTNREYDDRGVWTSVAANTWYKMLPLEGRAPPPKFSIWGQPVERSDAHDMALVRLFSPLPTAQDEDKILPEDRLILRYNDLVQRGAFPDAERFLPKPPNYWYEDDGHTYYWTDAEYAQLQEQAGQRALKRVRRMHLDPENPTPKDIERIQDAIADARRLVSRRLRAERRRIERMPQESAR